MANRVLGYSIQEYDEDYEGAVLVIIRFVQPRKKIKLPNLRPEPQPNRQP